jgi:hypothetical protein
MHYHILPICMRTRTSGFVFLRGIRVQRARARLLNGPAPRVTLIERVLKTRAPATATIEIKPTLSPEYQD